MMSLLSHTSFTLLDWLDYDRDVCIMGNEWNVLEAHGRVELLEYIHVAWLKAKKGRIACCTLSECISLPPKKTLMMAETRRISLAKKDRTKFGTSFNRYRFCFEPPHEMSFVLCKISVKWWRQQHTHYHEREHQIAIIVSCKNAGRQCRPGSYKTLAHTTS
jgi:hypothetical protein